MKKLEQTNAIIERLFDPNIKTFNTYVDTTRKKQIRKSVPEIIKKHYAQYCLEQHWEEICGVNLAKQCIVDNLDNGVLTIKTSSSLLATELYMMQKLFLPKVNKFLDKSSAVKELKFRTGKVQFKKHVPVAAKVPVIKISHCPVCGAKMTAEKKICSVCERQQRVQVQQKLLEQLQNQPWLTLAECQKYVACDSIAYHDAKEILENYYFEKVRLNYADKVDCCMAVMLLTGKSVDKLDDKLMENSLEFLRRNQDVSTSRV